MLKAELSTFLWQLYDVFKKHFFSAGEDGDICHLRSLPVLPGGASIRSLISSSLPGGARPDPAANGVGLKVLSAQKDECVSNECMHVFQNALSVCLFFNWLRSSLSVCMCVCVCVLITLECAEDRAVSAFPGVWLGFFFSLSLR